MDARHGKDAAARRLADQLERSRAARLRQYDADGLRPEFAALTKWQARRLEHTYCDLWTQDRYRPAVEFFLADLYGANDYSARDEGVERVYPIMSRMMPNAALDVLALGIELHALSQELDLDMIAMIWGEMNAGERLDAEVYAEAYRRCGDVDERRRQIALVEEVGRSLDDVVFRPLVYNAVRLARTPARLAGFNALHDFIERGFEAFRHMRGAGEFLDVVTERETAVMVAILDRRPIEEWAPPELIGAASRARAGPGAGRPSGAGRG